MGALRTLVSLCLVFLAADARAHEPEQAVQAARHVPWALNEALSPASGCTRGRHEGVLEREYGPPMPFVELYWSSTSCDLLLDPSPPLMLAIGSTVAGIDLQPWYPVCSPFFSNSARRDLAEKKEADGPVEVARAVRARTLEYDSCAKPTSEMRDGPGYVAPTQEDYGAHPMTGPERKAYYTKVAATRTKVRNICCAGEPVCAKLMDRVAITFCKHQTKKNEPDPCTENGTQYDNSDDAKDRMIKAMQSKSAKQLKGKFPLDPGFIQLSPLKNEDGEAIDDLSTVAHEFTHGCSMIRRELAVNAGDAEAQNELLTAFFQSSETAEAGPGCAITPETQKTYRKLFNKLAATDATYDCLEKVAETGASTRFPPAKPCYQGCPRSHLEESVAMWMQLETPLPKELKPQIYRQLCTTLRDNSHPLGMDVVRCSLLSPQIVKATKEGLQCKP